MSSSVSPLSYQGRRREERSATNVSYLLRNLLVRPVFLQTGAALKKVRRKREINP
jgi:hypothetical protein